jgi:MFS family permease
MFKGQLPAGLRALRHRNFLLYFFGQIISLTGSWIQLVAQSWLVYRMTDSAVMLGLVTFAGQTPGFFLAPLGGALADRLDRRRVLLVTQTCAMLLAFGLGLLTLVGAVEVWHVFVFAALLGIVNAFDLPSRQALIVEMVGQEDLMNAVTINSSAVNIARLAGPALAGVLVAALGVGWCFVANGLSFCAVIGSLLLMRAAAARRPDAARRTLVEHILEGFRFVGGASPVRALIILFGLVTLLGMPYAVLMPIFADRVLGGGPAGQGILMTAAGVGALVGTLCLMTRRETRRLANWTAGSAASFGLSLILFSLSGSFWLSAALLVPVGFSMMLVLATTNTIIQALTPDALRGRVMAAYTMAFLCASPVGALLAGWVSGQLGAQATVALGGVGCVAAAALFGLRLPALRDSARCLISLGVLTEPDAGASAAA